MGDGSDFMGLMVTCPMAYGTGQERHHFQAASASCRVSPVSAAQARKGTGNIGARDISSKAVATGASPGPGSHLRSCLLRPRGAVDPAYSCCPSGARCRYYGGDRGSHRPAGLHKCRWAVESLCIIQRHQNTNDGNAVRNRPKCRSIDILPRRLSHSAMHSLTHTHSHTPLRFLLVSPSYREFDC
jgi:hypothetical protein